MRTKTLLLTAAVTAAGIATSAAQVFSVNAVGYINLDVAPGFQMIANQLDAGDNSIQALLTDVEAGSAIFKFDPVAGGFDSAIFLGAGNGWLSGAGGPSEMVLEPGDGAFFQNTTADVQTITFVGEVPQGDVSQNVPANFSIQASKVPQAGAVDLQLGFPAAIGDEVFLFNTEKQGYDAFIAGGENADGSIMWFTGAGPGDPPEVEVGQSFFARMTADRVWQRSFSVND